jgi:PAS domain S-box-containing protein
MAAAVIDRDASSGRLAEARRRAGVDAALDAIITMNSEGRIEAFNSSAQRVFGYAEQEVIGQLVAEKLVPPDQREAHRRGVAHYRATGTGPLVGRVVEVTAMRADGTEFAAEMSITPLQRDGEALFIAHIRDISEHQAAISALKESERRRRGILARLLHAEEKERSRIATDLHDDTVQVMVASVLALDRAATIARATGVHEEVESAIMSARVALEQATERTRRLIFELRPAILHELGLVAAIGALVDQVGRETHSKATLTGTVGRFDHSLEELVYRSVQEALANARKHALPQQITVTLSPQSNCLEVEVADDGRGFDQARVKARPGAVLHLGLDSVRERVEAAGGTVDIDSAPGAGTRVRLSLPTNHARNNARS